MNFSAVNDKQLNTLQETLKKLGFLMLEPGILVIMKTPNGHQNGLEAGVLDEIAAAITAIKMYITARNGKRNTGKENGQKILKANNNGKSVAWFRAWLNEVAREFDFNPYRRSDLEAKA